MLDKNNFIDFLNNPQSLSLNDIMLMENMTKKYPYFQLGYTMIAKGIYTKRRFVLVEAAHDQRPYIAAFQTTISDQGDRSIAKCLAVERRVHSIDLG